MKMRTRNWFIGTRPSNAYAAIEDAAARGEQDGQRRYPQASVSGDTAADYAKARFAAEAETTSSLLVADHLAQQRIDDDLALAFARAEAARSTSRAAHYREAYEEALAESRAFKQSMPLAARAVFLAPNAVWGILGLLALSSGSALAAALLGVTEDQPILSYVIGLGVSLAGVVLGAAVGALLRRRDLDDLKEGFYSAHTRRWGILVLGAVAGIVAVSIGVSGLRGAASQADAQRQAASTSITVFTPGSVLGSAAAAATNGGVSRWNWLLFEAGVAMAAVAVEYLRSDARTEYGERLDKDLKKSRTGYERSAAELTSAVGTLEGAVAMRADHTGAIVATCDAHRQWAVTLSDIYRHHNNAVRGGNADPFDGELQAEPSPLARWLAARPSSAISACGASDNENAAATLIWDAQTVDANLLAAAYTELRKIPARPKRSATTNEWIPGRELRLDVQVQALDAATKISTPPSLHGKSNCKISLPKTVINGNGRAK